MREVLLPNGYVEVKTPLIYNKALWETSGHWEHYRQNMFLVEGSENEQIGVKAMNCPGHYLLYASQVHSYRELPIRFHEQTPLHRNEASGVLGGLTRVRQFSQDDGHCFVTQEQIGDEVERMLRLVQRVYRDFGLEYAAKLSTRPAEFLGDIATWDSAEAQLKTALERAGPGLYDQRGRRGLLRAEDRFRRDRRHRPQVAVRDDPARLPAPQRFELKYTGADNAEHRPVVIHRAIFGSFERFIAILIEHYAGRFRCGWRRSRPSCCPFRTGTSSTRGKVRDRLKAAGLRVDLDERQEKIGYKIREAQLQKMPVHAGRGRQGSCRGYGLGAEPFRRRSRSRRRLTDS